MFWVKTNQYGSFGGGSLINIVNGEKYVELRKKHVDEKFDDIIIVKIESLD